MPPQGNIGLQRGTVKLVDHNPNWYECFKKEKELLLRIVRAKIVDVRHIGSTSIPGVPAKPLVDILVALKALTDLVAVKALTRR